MTDEELNVLKKARQLGVTTIMKPRSVGMTTMAEYLRDRGTATEQEYREFVEPTLKPEPHMMVVRCEICKRGWLITNRVAPADICKHLIEQEKRGR